MANVKIAVTEEIIGHSNGQKHVLVTVATSPNTDVGAQPVLDGNGGKIGVTLSKVGKISSIIPLPIGMVAGVNPSLTSTIVEEGNTEGNTVTITVLKAGNNNLTDAATDGDLLPESGEYGVTFNFIAIGL